MVNIERDINYLEGKWKAKVNIIPKIENTIFKTIKEALIAKTKTMGDFEENFGYTRENYNNDSNYALTCGMVDALSKAYEKEKE